MVDLDFPWGEKEINSYHVLRVHYMQGPFPPFFHLIFTTAPEVGGTRWSLPQVHRGGKGNSKTFKKSAQGRAAGGVRAEGGAQDCVTLKSSLGPLSCAAAQATEKHPGKAIDKGGKGHL